jgi:hypothetical protein
MARENKGWGYDRIAGALANLGHQVSDQTIGNVLKRNGIAPAPKRSQSTTWRDFISAHMAVGFIAKCGTESGSVESPCRSTQPIRSRDVSSRAR